MPDTRDNRLQPSPKRKTAVDKELGRRVRLRRTLLELSQLDLARALGVTHQQVQKYESGSTRISASRMLSIAQALHVPVGWFFDGLGALPADEGSTIASARAETLERLISATNQNDVAAAEEPAIRLLRAYYSISDSELRADMLEILANFAKKSS